MLTKLLKSWKVWLIAALIPVAYAAVEVSNAPAAAPADVYGIGLIVPPGATNAQMNKFEALLTSTSTAADSLGSVSRAYRHLPVRLFLAVDPQARINRNSLPWQAVEEHTSEQSLKAAMKAQGITTYVIMDADHVPSAFIFHHLP